MEYSKLDTNAMKSWFISRGIATIIVTAVLFIIQWFFTKKIPVNFFINHSFGIKIFIGIIGLILLLNFILYPFIEYKQWRYVITKDKIEFSEGIYYIKTTIIPIIRVQHIRINQGPVNRMLNLANVDIFTAGGSHTIPNLNIEKANEIGKYLKEKIKEKVDKNDK
ncbi:PH domain-containing protein [Clostridium sp. Marseille-Q2269]|uniref:PH domain-containing protein n=1 Tax=Clostridium sp. Marseille-Q2269 TaxID=2942205 RepID=UPI0020740A19|nr:PH domain-containing protein [Clostridium sp. Marseille-Q2269]